MNDIMLDLEALGLGSNAVIIQIGACYFDRYTGHIGSTFKMNIDVDSSLRAGFEIEGRTVDWWMGQSDDARSSVTSHPKSDVLMAIESLNNFLAGAETVWSHSTFDFTKIENHINKLDVEAKFGHRVSRDIRTLVDLAGVDVTKYTLDGTAHTALDDCFFQVKYCCACFNILRRGKI